MKYVSPIISEARGSVAGITASRNRFGLYFKGKSSPVNPNTARQQAARANFAGLANDWANLLTQVQRTAWNLYGQSVVFTNPLGVQYNLTGYNHFHRSNGAILIAGLSQVLDAPTIFTIAESDPTFAAEVDETLQQISVTFDDGLAWANEIDGGMLIYMSSPKSPGREYIGGPTRYSDVIPGDETTPPTTPAVVPAPFAVAAGQKVEVLGRIVRADGRLSDFFRDSSIVIA